MSDPTLPAPHIPTPAYPLSTPRLPTDTGPTIPAPAATWSPPALCVSCGDENDSDGDLCDDCFVDMNDDCETEAEWLDRRLGW